MTFLGWLRLLVHFAYFSVSLCPQVARLGDFFYAKIVSLFFNSSIMEQIPGGDARETLQDMTEQEIAAELLPALMPGEALLPDDISVIRGIALERVSAGASLTDALIEAAALRFEARRKVATDTMMVHDTSSDQVHAVSSVDEARELFGRE